jgi:succinate-semialdehyde dehydrogenase/glutarate-semialdehyde dehydrogenase
MNAISPAFAKAGVTGEVPTDLFIAGQWQAARGGRRFDVLDPSTGAAIASVADGDADDALAALDAAAAALPDWRRTPPRERGEILRKCFELMTARAERLARLISLENGKALPDARAEVTYAAEFFRWFAEEAVRIIGEISTAPAGANRIIVEHQPIGVSLLITPWNFPAAMATRKLGPALAAGCTVILKPAAETPLTALAIAGIMADAGVPAGVVNVVTASNPAPISETLLKDPRLRKLSFTGSTAVGRSLLKLAAAQVISCSMELGGNAPFVVFDDADLDKALTGALQAKMRNGGEACTAANRFIVQRGIAERFAKGLAERMGAMALGPGYDEKTELGPMINAKAEQRIAEWVEEAKAGGAQVLVGGERDTRGGFYYPATVLTDVPKSSKLLTDEIFGPVAPISVFDTMEEAIAQANDTQYGLIAYVFSENLGTALAVAERLESGMVGINRGLISDPAAPFGGVKQSGLGREGAHMGIMEFLETKYIAVSF